MSQAMTSAPQTASATAPTAAPAASVADVSPVAASEQSGPQSLDSTEDIAAFLGGETDHQGETAATAQPDQDLDQDGEQGTEAQQDASPADQAAEAVPAPASWPKEEKEAFAKLPPDLQKVINRRETERDAFVKTKGEETAQARQRHDQLLQWTQNNLGTALREAQAAIMAEYADVDMLTLQRENPALFLQVDAEIKSRQARLQEVMRKHQEVTAYQAQENAARQKAFLAEEFKGAKDRLTAVNGPDMDAKAWKVEAEKFMEGLGCPKEHLDGISHAYQLELIAKAMQYDKLKANAASAAQKVAEAPRVMRPAGAGSPVSGTSEKEKAARRALQINPKSTEAIAGLLNYI